MNRRAILQPMSVLALWTIGVLLLTAFRRVQAVWRRRVTSDAFRYGESADVPADVAVVNRNLMNLLEVPVLFYVVSVGFYVTGPTTSKTLLALTWTYVALRMAHSSVHLTSNNVRQRLLVFACSNIVLTALWIVFLRRVVG